MTVLVVVVTCLYLGRWQWGVSQHTHSLQNLAYALQWPMFAVFFAVMWWRMLRLECRKLDGEFDDFEDDSAESPEVAQPAPAEAEKTATKPEPEPASVPASSMVDDEDAQLAAYNRMLAELAARDNSR